MTLTHQSDTRPAHQLLFIARDTGPVQMHAHDRRVELFDNKYCAKSPSLGRRSGLIFVCCAVVRELDE